MESTEQDSTEQLATLWEIARTIATTSSSTYHELNDQIVCPFCNSGYDHNSFDHVSHEEHCIVTKARNLVRQK